MFNFFKRNTSGYGATSNKWYVEYKQGEDYILMQYKGKHKYLKFNLGEDEFREACKSIGAEPNDKKWLRYTELNRSATSHMARKALEEQEEAEELILQQKELIKSSLKEMVDSGEFSYDPVKKTLVKGRASVVSDAELFFPRQSEVQTPLGSIKLSEEIITQMGRDKFTKLLNEVVIALKTNNDGLLTVGDYTFVLTDDVKYLPVGQDKLPIVIGKKVTSDGTSTDWLDQPLVETDRAVLALLDVMEKQLEKQE